MNTHRYISHAHWLRWRELSCGCRKMSHKKLCRCSNVRHHATSCDIGRPMSSGVVRSVNAV